MKGWMLLAMLLLVSVKQVCGQDADPFTLVQQMENLAANTERNLEKEDMLKNLDIYLRHPLNVNTADEEDLKGLVFLSDKQIRDFLIYRNLFGSFISKYELQAIPGWDLATIERIFPYVLIGGTGRRKTKLFDLLTKGDHSILFRMGRSLNDLADFDPDSSGRTKFDGGRDHVFLRYKYNYQNRIEWQWLGDKDAGETLFKGHNRYGFDFNSFHISLKNAGLLKLLVLGDFTVSMGQGLAQWQGIALSKSAEITSVKRSSPVIRPYTSSGETEFFRGLGTTLKRRNLEVSLFLSYRSISAHIDIDSINDPGHITSILSGGYHRTEKEQAQKNNVEQFSAGGAFVYNSKNSTGSVNLIMHDLSKPIRKEALPYNLYAASGTSFVNMSVDYSRTIKNLHLFGEAAFDKHLHYSILTGAMLSISASVDISFVGRLMDKAYQVLYASAFSENQLPANERGLYSGISLRAAKGLLVQGYADFFKFPWLKYRVDMPSAGKEFVVSIKYLPDKKTELSLRFKSEDKPLNSDEITPVVTVISRRKQGLQLQGNFVVNKSLVIKNRFETSFYQEPGTQASRGFLFFTDFSFKPPLKPWSSNFRLQYFEADNYDARIYAYENVMSYSFGFPAYYKKGFRTYVNYYRNLSGLIIAKAEASEKIGIWVRSGFTYYPPALVNGSKKIVNADVQIQILVNF